MNFELLAFVYVGVALLAVPLVRYMVLLSVADRPTPPRTSSVIGASLIGAMLWPALLVIVVIGVFKGIVQEVRRNRDDG